MDWGNGERLQELSSKIMSYNYLTGVRRLMIISRMRGILDLTMPIALVRLDSKMVTCISFRNYISMRWIQKRLLSWQQEDSIRN